MTGAGDLTGAGALVLVGDPIPGPGLDLLRSTEGLSVLEVADDEEAWSAALPEARGLLVRGRTVDRSVLEAAPELRAVGRAGVGVDNIDVAEATRRGVAVFNAPRGNTRGAAELTMALILALLRDLPGADRAVRDGTWDDFRSAPGRELHGRTLGIVGLGRIGSAVARRAAAFGARLVACDPYLDMDGRWRAAELGVELVSLQELLERSHVVTLHTPLDETTRGMIGAPELDRMREDAVLVNAARGGIVDEEALAEALREGRIAGAGLDVLTREPPSADHPLLRVPNVILTPHAGGATEAAKEAVSLEVAEVLRDAILEGDLRPAVNLEGLLKRKGDHS
jgi:D-3-phosphoglycerate dehydrogenase